MSRVKDEDLDYSDDQLALYDDYLFSGLAYEYEDSVLISEIFYKDGMLHDPSKTWYPSGKPFTEEIYMNNSRHGEFREWFESGSLKLLTLYEYGIVVKRTEWSPSGEVIKDYELLPSDRWYNLVVLRRTALSPN